MPADQRERLDALIAAAKAHQGAGESDAAEASYRQAIELGEALAAVADTHVTKSLVYAALELTNLVLARRDVASAHRILTDARRRTRDGKSLSGEMWTVFGLLRVAEWQKDFGAVAGYAAALGQLFQVEDAEREKVSGRHPEWSTPDRHGVYEKLATLGSQLYTHVEDYPRAEALAAAALNVSPGGADAYFTLGLAQLRQERYREAAQTWRQAIVRHPGELRFHANLAASLGQLGSWDEAAEAMTEAIALAPDAARYHFGRGQFLSRASRDEEAVNELTRALELAGAPEGGSDGQQEPAPGLASTPTLTHSGVLDGARLERAQAYHGLGRTAEADRDLDELIREGSPAAGTNAYRVRVRWATERGDHRAAVEASDAVLDREPDDVEARILRADAYLAQGLYGEAIPDLARAARRDGRPRDAIALADRILAACPGHALARKWRGFARFEAWDVQGAVADLSAALEALPMDPELHYWRGLARITHSRATLETWQPELTLEGVRRAIEDLGRAVQIDPDFADARAAYLWLVDRAAAEPSVLGWLFQTGSTPHGIYQVIPAMRELSDHMLGALWLRDTGRWHEAVEAWTTIQSGLVAAALPVTASRINLDLAEAYLRLSEHQFALDHLERYAESLFLTAQPLSESARADAERTRAQMQERSGTRAAVMEIDYGDVYGLGQDVLGARADTLRAQTYALIGDFPRALHAISERAPDVLGDIRRIGREAAFAQLIRRAKILRDGGEYERAAHLLQELDQQATNGIERALVYDGIGSLCDVLGMHKEAAVQFDAARANLTDVAQGDYLPMDLNIAAHYQRSGRLGEALELLEPIDVEREAPPPRIRYMYWLVLAQVLHGLGQNDRAQDAVSQALTIAEESRGRLRLYDDRISWQSTQETVYQLGLRIALARGDTRTALGLAEQAKARAFLDQLADGHLPTPPEAARLLSARDRLQAQRAILDQLLASLRASGPDFVDYPVIAALRQLDEQVDVLDTAADGAHSLSGAKVVQRLGEVRGALVRVDSEIEEATFRNNVRTTGSVLGADELRMLLAEAEAGAPNRIVLAEYFVDGDRVVLFVARSDLAEPKVIELAQPEDPQAFIRSHLGARTRSLDAVELQRRFGKLVSPLAAWTEEDDLLWIVPHGWLHYLPLHALEVGGRPLIVRNPVCYAGSASVMHYCRSRRTGRRDRALVLGDSRDDLPYAREESHVVAEVFGTTPVLGEQATKAHLQQALAAPPEMDVLHLACHAYFAEDPFVSGTDRSGIAMAPGDGESSKQEWNLTPREILGLRLHADLVTLSGCETGVNERRPGDELIGLTRAFLHAGTSAVIVSLWPISDLSSSLLMQTFYRWLRSNGSRAGPGAWTKAESLRRAQIALRDMTAAQIVDARDAQLARLAPDSQRARALRLARADAQAAAGDLRAAVAAYRAERDVIKGAADATGEADGHGITSRLEFLDDAEAKSPIDYTTRPFEHLYYWAPFVLVGDWS